MTFAIQRRAWDTQMLQAMPRHGKDNLDAPLPGDRGAHGPFDAEARRVSTQWWARTHPGALLSLAALAALGLRRLSH